MVRDSSGKWVKGFSGNEGNTNERKEINWKNALREYEKAALEKVVKLFSDTSGETKCNTQLKAAMFLLEQLHGKARQSIEINQNEVIDVEAMSTSELMMRIRELQSDIEKDRQLLEVAEKVKEDE